MYIGINLSLIQKSEEEIDKLRYSAMVKRVGIYDNVLVWQPTTLNYLNIQQLRLEMQRIPHHQASTIQKATEKPEFV